ncbi:uncharacterized protein STEHIDRAFT_122786 [Stereum hirsutum FP-91666 SS1]|uniref:uncharacterized protein n=1 Tax=Stereum hirsutum (strain FP-91666) TaxID=721885 RepID=UPI000444957C|nr:uncharacterized protein STEHIDRAFT_122786 [Stereum hirsutum FP-91666 SS1]EIM84837.1 hypothetical protein STEHIDRAFT_122786 [Stereum hirsutum FP-91666 SS1]
MGSVHHGVSNYCVGSRYNLHSDTPSYKEELSTQRLWTKWHRAVPSPSGSRSYFTPLARHNVRIFPSCIEQGPMYGTSADALFE